MRISLYIHAWQAVLMLLAGVISIAASQVGYLRSGGGALLLQQALVSFLPTKGKAGFESLEFDLAQSRMTVFGLYHQDIQEGENRAAGLKADRCEVRLDLWPRVQVDSILVQGVRNLELSVESGYLQKKDVAYPMGPPFPVYFEDIDLTARIGNGPVLRLTDCGGQLSNQGGEKRALTGEFRLAKLNGQPFDFRLTAHADGRWEVRGANLNIDTSSFKQGMSQLGLERLDPVALLIRALLTGDFGARGLISLNVQVLPVSASPSGTFECKGDVTFKDLNLRFPPQQAPEAKALPAVLGWMMGGDEGIWPHWLIPESISTGPDQGRFNFHMEDHRFEFWCDKGTQFNSRFSGREGTSLESLRGTIFTDAEHRPQEMDLDGYLDQRLSCQLRMSRRKEGDRHYELTFRPRMAGSAGPEGDENVPLWQFRSEIDDYSEAGGKQKDGVLLKFKVEVASSHCPDPMLLPPGAVDFSGRLRVAGRYRKDKVMSLDEIRWQKGGLVFGGKHKPMEKSTGERQIYGPLFDGMKDLWGGEEAGWRLQDMDLEGSAEVRFDDQARWSGTELKDWKLNSGKVIYKDEMTDMGSIGISVGGFLRKTAPKPNDPYVRITASGGEGSGAWEMALSGRVLSSGEGELRFDETNFPLKDHPERKKLAGTEFVKNWFNKRVSRSTILTMRNGKAIRNTLSK